MDSCYLCEIGKEGLIVPCDGRQILVCLDCVFVALTYHPKLAQFFERKESVHFGH